jgi:hypothetical protein
MYLNFIGVELLCLDWAENTFKLIVVSVKATPDRWQIKISGIYLCIFRALSISILRNQQKRV